MSERRTRANRRTTRTGTDPQLATLAERYQRGKSLRAEVPRAAHAEWHAPRRRPDPIEVLIASNRGRLARLIPIRHGRMMQSPFAFYRGAAPIMAQDLAKTPHSGLIVQACGDCHLMNFGGFATPERRVIFDINDFDETLPAPWEWDVKRLAASFVIAARHCQFSKGDCRASGAAAVRSYRAHLAEAAEMTTLERWYLSIEVGAKTFGDPELQALYLRQLRKERRRDPTHELARISHTVHGETRLNEDPPLLFRMPESDEPDFHQIVQHILDRYRESLSDDRRVLFDKYRYQDAAMKVVGVGSVGTLCGVLLFLASDADPLLLQFKQARESVLEPFVGKSPYRNHGERVVVGQRLMQAATDILLGWTRGNRGRHYYIRQLRDVKLRAVLETMKPAHLMRYADLCGSALARAHARSGDPAVLTGYLGKSDAFDQAIADFAVAYAEQNERDYAALVAAVRSGRIEARTEA